MFCVQACCTGLYFLAVCEELYLAVGEGSAGGRLHAGQTARYLGVDLVQHMWAGGHCEQCKHREHDELTDFIKRSSGTLAKTD